MGPENETAALSLTGGSAAAGKQWKTVKV